MNLQDFQPRKLLPIATIGIVVGAIDLPVLLSFGVLIYSGGLAEYAGLGIGMTLFAAIIMQLVITLTSSAPGLIGGPQDSPAAILAVSAASMGAAMIGAAAGVRFSTVLAMIIITTFLTGAVFLLLGIFKLSRFVRFVPYPVIGGFIAGTGLLLMQGAFHVMLEGLSITSPLMLFGKDALMHILPGFVFGAALMAVTRRFNHILVTPGMLLLGALIFYGYLFFSHTSLADARSLGWVLGPFPEGSLWRPFDLGLLSSIDWNVIAAQATNIGAIIMISVVALLLNSSALELISKDDIDLNRELISTGLANMLGAFTGGSAGYHYLSMSALSMRSGVRSRLIGLFSAGTLLIVLLFGAKLLSLVPKYMVGGLLVFIGLSFLIEWIYDTWFTLPKIEYALVLVIVAVVGWAGFLPGVAVGTLIAVILFAVNYSRIDIVYNALTGEAYRSQVDRPAEHHAILNRKGNAIHILRLEGYLFFGTAQGLLGRVRARIADKNLAPLRFLILDFKRVSALDSSAVFSFIRIHQLANANNIHLFLTEISPQVLETLRRGGMKDEADETVHVHPSMDEAAGFCEDRIIKEDNSATIIRAASLQAQLKRIFSSKDAAEKFMEYLEREEADEFHILLHQGDPPGAIYFVESGELAARLEVGRNKFLRLRTMGPGSMVGEIGLYLRIPSTATVSVSKKSVIYKLSLESLKKMEEENPVLSSNLHRWIVLTLSQRLSDNNRTLEAMMK